MLKIELQQLFTIPNLLTLYRFLCVPFLLGLAWNGEETLFLVLLLTTFVSDVLDGLAARLLHQESDLGALLDSWADILVYSSVTLATAWLRPELLKLEKAYVVLIVLSYLLPILVGWIKFKDFTRYHTWLVKLAVAAMGGSYFLLMWFDWSLPFHLASFLCVLAAVEEIVLTLMLDNIQSNVKTIWHVWRQQENHKA